MRVLLDTVSERGRVAVSLWMLNESSDDQTCMQVCMQLSVVGYWMLPGPAELAHLNCHEVYATTLPVHACGGCYQVPYLRCSEQQ